MTESTPLCEHCSAAFTPTRRGMRFCSRACANEARKKRQPRPPCRICGEPRDTAKKLCSGCISDPQVYRACPRCGVVFNCAYVDQKRAALQVRKYCSTECRSQASSDALSGRGKPPNATCEQCGEPFTRGKQVSKRFCSVACGRLAQSKRQVHVYVETRCAWCDKACTQRKHDAKRYSHSFCDKTCSMRYAWSSSRVHCGQLMCQE